MNEAKCMTKDEQEVVAFLYKLCELKVGLETIHVTLYGKELSIPLLAIRSFMFSGRRIQVGEPPKPVQDIRILEGVKWAVDSCAVVQQAGGAVKCTIDGIPDDLIVTFVRNGIGLAKR